MGLFDFLKGAGKKIENESDTAAELKKDVDAMGLGLKDFNVEFANGTATLKGTAASQKDLEMARLVVGNHQGVEKVNDDGLKVEGAAKPETGKMYTVKAGDTLSKIAKEEMGDANKYPELFDANKPMLSDPDKIYPGQVLRIPTKMAA
jgi:nucleoid-associated protein YgaU